MTSYVPNTRLINVKVVLRPQHLQTQEVTKIVIYTIIITIIITIITIISIIIIIMVTIPEVERVRSNLPLGFRSPPLAGRNLDRFN